MSVLPAGDTAIGARGNVSLALTLGLALFLLVNAFALNSMLRLVSPRSRTPKRQLCDPCAIAT